MQGSFSKAFLCSSVFLRSIPVVRYPFLDNVSGLAGENTFQKQFNFDVWFLTSMQLEFEL